MKKHIIFFAAAIIMVAAGCSKNNDIPTGNTQKIEFSVAEKPSFGAQTKAVKTGWEVGDQIAIAMKPSSETYIVSNKLSKSEYSGIAVLLEYTESGWTATQKTTTPSENGTFYAVHHRGGVKLNFLAVGTATPENSYKLTGYQGGELMSFSGSYSVANNGNLILSNITMALDPRLMQISTAELLEGNEDTDNDVEFLAALYMADGGEPIEQPEKTIKMSIYKNWTSGNTPETMNNWVALSNGSVSVDFSDNDIFVYNSADKYKTGATPIPTYYDEYECDYSFCFAYNGGKSSELISRYTFYIERTPEEGAEYTISYDELYQTVDKSATRILEKGKAIKLSDQGWIAVTN